MSDQADDPVEPAPVIPRGIRAFGSEPHLAFLATLRADGSPHVAPVGFMIDEHDDIVRVITFESAQKVRNVECDERVSVSWVDGPRWATIQGRACVRRDDDAKEAGLSAYALKYRPPKDRTDRVIIEICADQVICSGNLQV